jgi:hypothetical protein
VTLAVLAALAAAALYAARSWRKGLLLALVLVVIEGAIRKWIAPGAASYVYFGKDLVLLGVYFGYLRDGGRRRFDVVVPPPLVVALGATLAIALLQMFNPRLPSLLVGVLGFKAYALYVPLLRVVPAAFRDEGALAAALRRYLWLAVPVGLLAFAQFFSPPESFLNTYARAGDAPGSIITFGAVERVRVTGTFSFITGYASYVQVISLLALSALSVRRWRIRGSLVLYVALVVTVVGMLMTGSRAPVFQLLLSLPIYWLFGVAKEGGVPAIGRFLLGLGLVVSLVSAVGADAVDAFRARAAGSSDVAGRVVEPFVNPVRIAPDVGLLGYGTGSTHQMAEVVTGRSLFPYSWLGRHHYEDEPSRIMVELGVLGFVAFFAARILLVAFALRAVFVLSRPLPRALALSALLLFLSQLTGGVVFNVTGGLYYWFFGGLLMLCYRLDREARPARRREVVPSAAAPAFAR